MATRGVRALLGLGAGTVLLVGSAACSGLTVSPTSAPSPSVASSSPSEGPEPAPPSSSSVSAPPDATLADLATITVPAYCGRPASSLSSGAMTPTGESEPAPAGTSVSNQPTGSSDATSATSSPSSDAGSATSAATSPAQTESGVRPTGRGELVADGPTAPVLVDVTGDGVKEAVGEYRCDDGGTPWPSMIVVARAGGELLGHVKLGDIARTERAAVTSWQPGSGGLVVDWVAFRDAGLDKRPYENLLHFAGAAVSFSPTERGRTLGQTTIVDGAEATSFVTPTGKVGCTLDGASVTCAVSDPAWRGEAQCSGTVDAVALTDGRAAYACSGGAPFDSAATEQDPPWLRVGSDPTIHAGAGRMAGLAFGRTLTTGLVTCTVATAGVTCSDRLTGHGFTVAPESVRTF